MGYIFHPSNTLLSCNISYRDDKQYGYNIASYAHPRRYRHSGLYRPQTTHGTRGYERKLRLYASSSYGAERSGFLNRKNWCATDGPRGICIEYYRSFGDLYAELLPAHVTPLNEPNAFLKRASLEPLH